MGICCQTLIKPEVSIGVKAQHAKIVNEYIPIEKSFMFKFNFASKTISHPCQISNTDLSSVLFDLMPMFFFLSLTSTMQSQEQVAIGLVALLDRQWFAKRIIALFYFLQIELDLFITFHGLSPSLFSWGLLLPLLFLYSCRTNSHFHTYQNW